jgi:aminopeptidase N
MASGFAQKLNLQTLPYDSASVPRERFVDFEDLNLDVRFEPKEGRVLGQVKHTFRPLRPKVDSLFLDGPGIQVERLEMAGKPLRFQLRDDKIWVYFEPALVWEHSYEITIAYSAQPRKGLYFIGWNDPTGRSRKQIWTQGQGTDNRCWIPMYDNMNDKVRSELHIRMPKPYKVLSNGERVSVNTDGADQIWHYRMNHPHAPYLIMMGIGEYEIEKRIAKSGKPMELWYYPDQADRMIPTYRYSVEMFDFFEQEIGLPYPWESYSQIPVQDFMYGAMENTTATLFGDFFQVDARGYLDRNYVGVNAHELAHQWFGDYVTAVSPTHHWLQESFATHYNMMFEGVAFGKEHLDMARRRAQYNILDAGSKDDYPLASSKAGSTRWYPKGAMVLYMLKNVVGRESFNKAILHYLQRNPYSNVDSHDLQRSFEEVTGQPMAWFWEQWIYRGGEPSYNVEAELKPDETIIQVRQMQVRLPEVGFFRMPIEFEVWYTDGSVDRRTVWIENAMDKVSFPNPLKKNVAFWLFDPDNKVLKSVFERKSIPMCLAQVEKAPNMLDRLDGIRALKSQHVLSDYQKELLKLYSKEHSVSVRSSILQLVSNINDKEVKRIFHQAFKDPNYKIRQAAIEAVDTLQKEFIADVIPLLSDSSYQTIEMALEKLCVAAPERTAEFLKKTEGIVGNNAHNVQIAWLKLALRDGQMQHLNTLLDLCSPGYEFNTRRAAFTALKELDLMNETLLDHAWNAMLSPNSRLSSGGLGMVIWAYNKDAAWKSRVEERMKTLGQSAWERSLIDRITAKPKG